VEEKIEWMPVAWTAESGRAGLRVEMFLGEFRWTVAHGGCVVASGTTRDGAGAQVAAVAALMAYRQEMGA
jgi:hypothetical protein